jgi:CubicO group peptidase (beta-lactamase class C family)
MKKVIVTTALVLLLLTGVAAMVLPRLGFSTTDLASNMHVGTGIGAKLGCSGRYLSGLDDAQMRSDLASYTAAMHLVDIRYDDTRMSVEAELFGMAPITARYRTGLGCTLEIGDTTALDKLEVPRLTPTQGPWPLGEADNALDESLQQLAASTLDADNAAGLQTRALLVAHHGALRAEAYADGFHAGSVLLGWSMAKSLTAILFGQLEMMGLVSIDEAELFAQWADDARADITLENLLQMSSGLDFSEVYAPGSDATAMLFTSHSASDVALSSPLAHAPGSRFYYSSGTTNILARLLTERLGGSQAALDFLYQGLFEPLGIRRMLLELDPSGVFVGSSYVYGSGRDWARLGQLMLNGGAFNGARLLSEDWVKRARSPNASGNDPRYGYQFWLNGGGSLLRWPQLPADAYAMTGNRGQVVMIVPSENAVLVRLGWSASSYPIGDNFAALLDGLRDD